MKILIAALLPSVVTASLEVFGPSLISGSSIPAGLDANSRQLVANAQQHPNATRGVDFKPFKSLVPSEALSIGNFEFTWRINVSDFAAPNATQDLSSGGSLNTEDTHIVTTSYDFHWPGSEFSSTAARFCFTVADVTGLPANVTDAYTEGDIYLTSCVSALGQACVDAIVAGGKFVGNPADQFCQAPHVWTQIPECQSTLGSINSESHSFGLVAGSRGFSNNDSQTATAGFANGEGWFGFFSSPQNGSGSNEYYTAVNRLHIATVNTLLASDGNFRNGFKQQTQLLCMRVNATELSTDDTNGDDVTESTGYSLHQNSYWSSMIMGLAGAIFVVVANIFLP
ncbi:hypothetical protein F4777DRAFT_574613 [Nemania sp. FL0916]|nr:hypothetical protein F4777DRAFT_574613 [Nemania sp. FL0916]